MSPQGPCHDVHDFTRFEDATHPSTPELLKQIIINQPHSTNLEPYVDAAPVNHEAADAPRSFIFHSRNDTLHLDVVSRGAGRAWASENVVAQQARMHDRRDKCPCAARIMNAYLIVVKDCVVHE